MLIHLNTMLMALVAATAMNCTHPISLAGNIVVMTLLICFLNYLILPTSWYAFIFFLIFLGGVMVMFMYVTSLASNENFSMSWKNTPLIILILASILLAVFYQFEAPLFYPSVGVNPMTYKIYSTHMSPLIVSSMIFLLFALIVVVEIIKILKSPLRSFL